MLGVEFDLQRGEGNFMEIMKEETEQALESRTPSWARLSTFRYVSSIYENNIPTRKPGPGWKNARAHI